MKLTIEDGRDSFYTFDTNRILLLTATDEEQINQVEFSTEENGETVSWTSDVLTGEDGIKFVQVPNEFLNGNYSRLVCYYVALDSKGEYTRQKEIFRIRVRQQPEDYFLTYSERVTFASIKALTEQYKVTTKQYMDTTEGFKNNASNSAGLAKKYAENNEDESVETGTYSAKHWSIKTGKKYDEIKEYVGSASKPTSALGLIESAKQSSLESIDAAKQSSLTAITDKKTESISNIERHTNETAIPSITEHVNGTVIPTLNTYVESAQSAQQGAEMEKTKAESARSGAIEAKNISVEAKTASEIARQGAEGARDTAVAAKNAVATMKSSVEQTVSDFNTLAAEKKAEVESVYQTDLNKIKGDLTEISNTVFLENEKKIEWVVGFINTGGNFKTSTKDKVLKPVPLYKGETVKVKTKGDGIYLFTVISKVDSEDIPIAVGASGGTALVTLTNNTLTEYTYTATEDMFITVCVFNDDSAEVVFENLKKESRIDVLEDNVKKLSTANTGALKNKSIMYFGDSLMSASGVIGFAEIIANNYNMPIRKFIYDSADGNSQDVPVDYKCFTNYAKDGTMNRVIPERKDSVLERVKRHITTDTDVDYVLIECCVNDMASENRNKGSITDGYTSDFDISTSIGAIEETLRYLTTLGKPIKIGAFIPWLISWNTLGWFDDYVAVFEKWGVPVFDMIKCSGFNLYKCAKHRLLYTLSSDSYESYDNTKTYNLDDKVKYQGTLYKCIANGVVGVLPTDTTKWMSVSSETADGTHLNNLGHQIVSGKIQNFIESL